MVELNKSKKKAENKRKLPSAFDFTIHIVFLVHGFKGRARDMQRLSNILALRCPKIRPVIITSIEKYAEDPKFDIKELGKLLSQEVEQEISENWEGYEEIKISFIGHSLGGLLIRSALQELEHYKDNFQTLMTLGTPHWGYMHSSSSLVSLGIKIYDRMVDDKLLHQLKLSDAKNTKDTRIYKLSKAPQIGYFKQVLIFGSDQDTFASIETSLIKESSRMKKRRKYKRILEMQDSIQ